MNIGVKKQITIITNYNLQITQRRKIDTSKCRNVGFAVEANNAEQIVIGGWLLYFHQGRQFRFLKNLIGRNHCDDMPGANLGAEFAANTNDQIDRADSHGVTRNRGVGYFIDAVHRADRDTSVAAGTQILIKDCQLLGEFLLFRHL